MNKLLLLFCLLIGTGFYAQSEGSVKGNITDMEMGGEPLMFALIEIEGTNWSTETNFNGNFELEHITPGNYTIEISSLGYSTLSLPIEVVDSETIYIQEGLHAKQMSLEEVQTLTSTKKTAFAGK